MELEEETRLRKQRKIVPAIGSILVYIGLFYFLCIIVGLVALYLLHFPADGNYTIVQRLSLQLCTLGVVLFSAWFVLRWLDRRSLADLGLGLKGRGRDIGCGLLVALAIYGIGFGVSLLLGAVEVAGFGWNPGVLATSFLFFVLVSMTEEIMVRGYVLGRLLRTRLNKFVSLGISSLLFSLMHVFNPNTSWVALLNIFLAGCLLGASFLYTRNLWFPISLHLFWNWIQGPVLGYKVSGMELGDSLLVLRTPEPGIVNGGAFGFEGSILCTVLLVVATGLIVWWYERRG